MPIWEYGIDLTGVLLAVVLVFGLALVLRRRWLGRAGGTFDVSLRTSPRPSGRGWLLGLARYSGDRLEWFRVFSLSVRPKRVMVRSQVEVKGRRNPHGSEAFALYSGHIVVCCVTDQGPLEVAMAPDALTGFLAWLEAAPPGHNILSA